jgi:hypothetical protein
MRVTKAVDVAPRCAAIWGPNGYLAGQQCGETAPHLLIKCNRVLDPGCENYYCLMFHWHDHWDTHTEKDATP